VDIDMPPKQPKKVQNQKAMPHDRSSMEHKHKEKKGMAFRHLPLAVDFLRLLIQP